MATQYISRKFSYDNAYRFIKEAISVDPNRVVKYIFLGTSYQFARGESYTDIEEIYDTVQEERNIWDTIFAGKQITGSDVEMVIQKIVWEEGKVYKQFDDQVDILSLVTPDYGTNIQPMYMMNSEGNVYKCLYNNRNSVSEKEPRGDFNVNNGYIVTTDSIGNINYIWKYLYNIKNTNKFMNKYYIPVPYITGMPDYNNPSTNLQNGSLANIVMVSKGSGYINGSAQTISDYIEGDISIRLNNTNNVRLNMIVSGPGIIPRTTVIKIEPNTITLSLPTIGSGDVGTTLNFHTNVTVEGDGSKIELIPILNNGEIEHIYVTSVGIDYTKAKVNIYGTGTGAEARAVISPKFGHGYNPARELLSNNIMVSMKIGGIDSTENGKIPVDTSIGIYGILSDPHAHGDSKKITKDIAPDIFVQTTKLELIAGEPFSIGEVLYQGQRFDNSTFSGVVHDINPITGAISLINVKGSPTIGGLIKGNIINRIVSSVIYPDLEPYSGDIIHVKQEIPIQRMDGQAEVINIVINF